MTRALQDYGSTVDGFGKDKTFHPILYDEYNYLSMLGLKLIHVS